jgi:hypothetical protein
MNRREIHVRCGLDSKRRKPFDRSTACSLFRPVVAAMVMLLACTAALAGDAAGDDSRPVQLRPHIASCGVASVYCALEELGVAVDQADLEARFRRVHGNDDLSSLTVEELVQVLRQFGVPAVAAKFDPPDVDRVPTPAILYVAQQFRSRVLGTGHFAVLTGVNDEYGTMVDLTLVGEGREDGVVEVHKGRLRSVWKGEAIVLRGNSVVPAGLFSNRNLSLSALLLFALTLYFGIGGASPIRKTS